MIQGEELFKNLRFLPVVERISLLTTLNNILISSLGLALRLLANFEYLAIISILAENIPKLRTLYTKLVLVILGPLPDSFVEKCLLY